MKKWIKCYAKDLQEQCRAYTNVVKLIESLTFHQSVRKFRTALYPENSHTLSTLLAYNQYSKFDWPGLNFVARFNLSLLPCDQSIMTTR